MAAGKGTRMKSDLPKVLHNFLGKPMLFHVISTLREVGIKDICLILNSQTDPFHEFVEQDKGLTICIQKEQRGTGDAIASGSVAMPQVKPPYYTHATLHTQNKLYNQHVIICCGDTPALRPSILREFIDNCYRTQCSLGVIGLTHPNPTGYGRMILDNKGHLQRIVEEKDADAITKQIHLINTGIIFADTQFLFGLLDDIKPNNSQNEYYLTDCFALAAGRGHPAYVHVTNDVVSFSGINTPQQLKDLESLVLSRNHPNPGE